MKLAVVNVSLLIHRILRRFRVIWVVLLASLLLSGCVKYDVVINFNNENSGTLVQEIQLGEKLASFSQDQVAEWVRTIEKQAKQLQGKTRKLDNQTVLVTIPFSSGQELLDKFNQFFHPDGEENSPNQAGDLPNIESKLNLKQINFFVVQRNKLSYSLDLRSLAVLSSEGSTIISPDSLLDLQFSLKTPWGAKIAEAGVNSLTPEIYDNGQKLLWTLKPGEVNSLEVIFWVPSPLGIGTIAIMAIVWVGFYLKYQSFRF